MLGDQRQQPARVLLQWRDASATRLRCRAAVIAPATEPGSPNSGSLQEARPPRVVRHHLRRSLSLELVGRPNTVWPSPCPSKGNQGRQTRSSADLWESPDSRPAGYALAFAALSATNEAILRSSNAGEMLQKVTEAAVDGGGLLGAAIFRKEDGSARLQMEAGAGAFVAPIAKMPSTDPAVPHGQGLGGIAFRSNKPCISNNVTSDTRIRPWWDLAKAAGVKTLAVFPICVGGAPVGVINFFLGDEHGQLDEEATSLMSRLAENVSFGLEMFKREEARHSAQKEQDNLHRMYVALSATNEAIMRSTTRDERMIASLVALRAT